MSDNTASFEAREPMARRVSNSILTTLGVDEDEVSAICVELVTEDGEETEVTFKADGPRAGAITAAMFGGVDFGRDTPVEISVALDADPNRDDGSRDIETTEVENSELAGRERDPDSRPEEKPHPDDFATEESPATSTGKINEGTTHHRALGMLAQYEADNPDARWVSATDLYDGFDNDFPESASLSSALSTVFREKGFCERRRVPQPDGGIEMEYAMDDAAWDELERIGMPERFSEQSVGDARA